MRYEVICDERRLLTIDELGRQVQMHPEMLRRYLVFGLIDPEIETPCPLFADTTVIRIRKIERLRGDLGINLAGCGLVLDLLDRIDRMEEELRRLRDLR